MKYYLVGGAVRDELLGIEVAERDWVIVGGSPQILLKKGFTSVGRDFPVFLHPKTKEEYALARKERKIGKGYHGFDFIYDSTVTLEEDLARRDLTINAMAKDEYGNIIDPYGGKKDLDAKLLRHVSEAFIEDPVRVLRVARFAARFHHLGFKIAKQTMSLMYKMVRNKELDALVPERVWKEMLKALSENTPTQFFTVLRACGALKVTMPEIDRLFGIPARKVWHPEIDTGVHTLLAIEQGAKLSKDPRVRFATVVHDLGKGLTPMDEWPSHHQHDVAGVKPIQTFCRRLKIPKTFEKLAINVSKYHILSHKVNELRPKTIVDIIERLNALKFPQEFNDFLTVCEADARGRLQLENVPYEQAQRWLSYLKVLKTLDNKDIIKPGMSGEEIKNRLIQAKIKLIKQHQKRFE